MRISHPYLLLQRCFGLNMTDVKLELIREPEKYLMFESNNRGGVCKMLVTNKGSRESDLCCPPPGLGRVLKCGTTKVRIAFERDILHGRTNWRSK